MKPVTHLHFHSEYSLQDSLIKIDQFPELIKKKNIKAIALTDHANVDGAIKFYLKTKGAKIEDESGKEIDFIPLLGCEFYVVDDFTDKTDRKRWHLTAIAKNLKGFQSIMKALTVANLEGFYYRPRISWKYILSEMNNIVVMTACNSGMLMRDDWQEQVSDFHQAFGDDFYLEAILLKDYKPSISINEIAQAVSESMGIEIAFTNDVHMIEKEDWPAKNVCLALAYNKRLDSKTYKEKKEDDTADYYTKTYDEMVDSLKHFGFNGYEDKMSAVWDKVAIACDARRWFNEPMKPTVPVPKEIKGDKNEYLKNLCREKFKECVTIENKESARKRMEHELKEICELGFAEYFLLVMDMVQWAKANEIMVGVGRGSVGGSLVAYLLGITSVNPLDYDLVFERFISPGRHDLPDIDLDFEDIKRDQIIEYLRERYGQADMKHNVALVSTHASMKGRGALRDVSRVFDVPLSEVGPAAKQILVRSGGDARASFSIEDTISLFEVSSEFAKKYPYVINEAKKLEGLMKNKGVHAAGIVVDTTDLYDGEKCVLLKAKDGDVAVNWDKKDLEYMGLMKIDALGLKTLNVLHTIKDFVKKNHPKDPEIDWEELIPLDEKVGTGKKCADPEAIKRFADGDTIGIFQFGSTGMIQYLRDFQPENFKELYQVNALYRPGTLRSGMANKFIRFKKGDIDEKPDYINKELETILKDTYGIVLFQEQIMYILNRLGDIPWRTADTIRKVVSKSEGQEKFETFRGQFLAGVKKLNSMSEKDAHKIFGLMKFFGSYGFNKSHSVEYTILGYWTMWAKVHYPLEFYCANLMRHGDKEETAMLLSELGRTGAQIRSPDINKSDGTWKIESTDGNGAIRAGFDIIKGISERLSSAMIKCRQDAGGEFKSFKHFHDNVPKQLVNIARVKALLLADAFSDLLTEEERRKMLIHIEQKKKVPSDLKSLEEIDVNEYEGLEAIKQEVFSYELPEAFLSQNKIFLDKIIRRNYTKIVPLASMKKVPEGEIMGDKWFIGKFDEIKYGYRTAIDKKKDEVDTRGYASDLGGVYGIFRDDTYLYYATFGKDLYHAKSDLKGKIEGAAGKYMLIRANKPLKSTNLFVQEMYFIDDIKHGVFYENLDTNGIIQHQDKEGFGKLEELRVAMQRCSKCGARQYCTQVVPFSIGDYRAMIVGMDPGKEEDEAGVPFVGLSGKALWEGLGMDKEFFHVTNVQKCKHRGEWDNFTAWNCADRWLKEELELVKPKLILSLGSQALQCLSGDKKAFVYKKIGMEDGSSKIGCAVEWNKVLEAWVVYTLHPSWALHSGRIEEWKKDALGRFRDMFLRLL